MRAQCRTKLCRNGEDLDLVSTVHQPVPVPSPDPGLRKDAVSSLRLGSEEVDSVIKASEESEKRPGTEWLREFTEQFNNI